MESDKAYKALLKISKENNFKLLKRYLETSEPIKIKVSSLPLIEYLSSVVVSQQLSTKAAKTIWSRVHPIIKSHTNSTNLDKELRLAGLSRRECF
jgi:3-methyladenine DNA glycosylase/8-oxoguanine DNA glycosylase